MVAMRASRVFKKYWGKYTDMGSAFLDNLQGLETLKTFDADEAAAKKMHEEAENFRVMTMRVLQIQLRSLTAGPISVHAHNLGFFYGDDEADAQPALRKVSLDIPAHSLIAIVGESGSGKSTLAALIAGELEGYSGSV